MNDDEIIERQIEIVMRRFELSLGRHPMDVPELIDWANEHQAWPSREDLGQSEELVGDE
jgi:hypothetical protein